MTKINFEAIEKKWQKTWEKKKVFEAKTNKKKKYYVLEMFPYPSGTGLHMGHALNYSIGDIYARFKRMEGFNVLYPMGYDSLGLPAENAAIKAGIHPKKYTDNSIKNFIKQQKSLGLSYDWSRQISTSNPEYYKWDQWMFLKMLEKGLAYKKEAPVNWCSKCNTVLANEQVHNGSCWRHEKVRVEIKILNQWFFKITAYAEELANFEKLQEWPSLIKKLQKNWIGKSFGTEISFEISSNIKKVVLVHGKNTNPSDKWYRWLNNQVKKRNIPFIAPVMPGASDPEVDVWINEIEKTKPDGDTVLIGHSRGGVAILRWLENLPKGRKVGKVILVATNSGSSEKINRTENSKGFFNMQGYNFNKIKSHCEKFVVIHSKDDHLVPFEAGKENAERLNAKFKVYEGKRHFGIKESSEAPEVLEEIFIEWPVFTTRPDTLFGVTFMVVSAQHPRLDELVTIKQKEAVQKFVKKLSSVSQEDIDQLDKEGVFTGSYAVHPLTKQKIPVYAGNFVLAEYGSGMVMAVPAHDQRDFEFAKKYKIPMKGVIHPKDYKLDVRKMKKANTEPGILFNSDKFDGLESHKAKQLISEELEKQKLGKKTINFRLRDWLISRQRYWGTPIPIIYCKKCGAIPVPEKDLPVKLPEKVIFGKGNPLKTNKNFVKAKCPKCGGLGERETDTMDTFVNSSWYYLRYTDPKNKKKIFDTKNANYWCPIDFYIGGKEHACMHLIFIRFYTKFLRDLGILNFDEPAIKMFNQGMLHGEDGNKMSKSLGNVIDPLDTVKKHGADALRLFLISVSSPDSDMNWSDKGVQSSEKLVTKIYDYFTKVKYGKSSKRIESKINRTIKDYTQHIKDLKYNLAIIKLRQLFEDLEEEISKDNAKIFIKLLHPICPHITEELWEKIGGKGLITTAEWPVADEKKIDKKLEQAEKAAARTIEDIKNILRIIEEKQNKQGQKVYVYVMPFEINYFDAKQISMKVGKPTKIFAVNDKKKYDPTNKAPKSKPGKPAIYIE